MLAACPQATDFGTGPDSFVDSQQQEYVESTPVMEPTGSRGYIVLNRSLVHGVQQGDHCWREGGADACGIGARNDSCDRPGRGSERPAARYIVELRPNFQLHARIR